MKVFLGRGGLKSISDALRSLALECMIHARSQLYEVPRKARSGNILHACLIPFVEKVPFFPHFYVSFRSQESQRYDSIFAILLQDDLHNIVEDLLLVRVLRPKRGSTEAELGIGRLDAERG